MGTFSSTKANRTIGFVHAVVLRFKNRLSTNDVRYLPHSMRISAKRSIRLFSSISIPSNHVRSPALNAAHIRKPVRDALVAVDAGLLTVKGVSLIGNGGTGRLLRHSSESFA